MSFVSPMSHKGTPISKEQEHEIGKALAARSTDVSSETHAASANMCRMPLFVASSQSLETAQQFTSIRSNGVACPILEFILPKGQTCDSVACVEPLSHFPDEKEWLMCAYSAFEYRSQRLEYLEIGRHSQLKLVMIVQYTVLPHQKTFEKFEAAGQDIKTAMMLCKPPTVWSSIDDVPISMPFPQSPLNRYVESCSGASGGGRERRVVELKPKRDKSKELPISSENEVREIIDNIHNDEVKAQAVEMLTSVEKRILRERQHNQEAQDKLHSLSLKGIKMKEAIAQLIFEKDVQLRNIQLLKDKLKLMIAQEKSCELSKSSMEEKISSASEDIHRFQERTMEIRHEEDTVTCQITEYKKKMEPLLFEERAAFRRWEAREKSKKTSEMKSSLSWEEKLMCVERAKGEFIEAVFPPQDLQALQDRLWDLEAWLNSISQDIVKRKRDIEVFTAVSDVMISRMDQHVRNRSLLEENLTRETKKYDDIMAEFEIAVNEEKINSDLRKEMKSEVERFPLTIHKIWNDLGCDVKKLLTPAVRVVGQIQELESAIASFSVSVVFFSASW